MRQRRDGPQVLKLDAEQAESLVHDILPDEARRDHRQPRDGLRPRGG